jgi:DNA-binding NarL/FixJ family response regulator
MMTGVGVDRRSPAAGAQSAPPGAETFVLRRVLLVNPDPTQRALVTAQLREFGAVQVIEVGDLAEARAAARSPGARDLAVLGCDPGDPEFSSLLAELDGQGWYRVVVVMPQAGTRQIVSALLAGATGVLTASGRAPTDPPSGTRADPNAAVRAWNAADEPEGGVRPGVRYVPDLRGMPRALTHREQEILQLAANGHPNREIAEELGLSPLTIKSHLGRIGRKLGSGDRAQLVLLALRAGAIS